MGGAVGKIAVVGIGFEVGMDVGIGVGVGVGIGDTVGTMISVGVTGMTGIELSTECFRINTATTEIVTTVKDTKIIFSQCISFIQLSIYRPCLETDGC
jgi:hypothetical protein